MRPGSSRSVSGLARVSAMILSRTWSSRRPATVPASSARAAGSSRPSSQQLGEAVEVGPGGGFADGDHDGHRLRQHPAADEAEDVARCRVEPLRILHEAEQRPLVGRGRQQDRGRRGRPGSGPGRAPDATAQGDVQGVALRREESGVEPGQHRGAELVDPGEWQLHLGLHADDLRDPEAARLTGRVPQQGGLADAGLAADHEDAALPVTRRREQTVERGALGASSDEPRRTSNGHLGATLLDHRGGDAACGVISGRAVQRRHRSRNATGSSTA